MLDACGRRLEDDEVVAIRGSVFQAGPEHADLGSNQRRGIRTVVGVGNPTEPVLHAEHVVRAGGVDVLSKQVEGARVTRLTRAAGTGDRYAPSTGWIADRARPEPARRGLGIRRRVLTIGLRPGHRVALEARFPFLR